jgi:hypothetical protein
MAITLDTTTSTITIDGTGSSQGTVRFYENTGNGTNFVALAAPAAVSTNVTFALPAADGTDGQVLKTDGSGTLSFTAGGINTGKSIAVSLIFGL